MEEKDNEIYCLGGNHRVCIKKNPDSKVVKLLVVRYSSADSLPPFLA